MEVLPPQMSENIPELSLFIVGITAIFKKIGLPSQWLPLVAVALGSLYSFSFDFTLYSAIKGALLGLMITGTVSAVDDRLAKTGSIIEDCNCEDEVLEEKPEAGPDAPPA